MAVLGRHRHHLLAEHREGVPLDDLVHVNGPAAIQVAERQRQEPVRYLRKIHDYAVGLRQGRDHVVRIARDRDERIGMVVLLVHEGEMLRVGVEIDRIRDLRFRESADLDAERRHTAEHIDDDLAVPDLGGHPVPLACESGIEVDLRRVGMHPRSELLVDGLRWTLSGHELQVPDPELALDSGIGEHAAEAAVGAHHRLPDALAIWFELLRDLDHAHVPDHIERYGEEIGQSVREVEEVPVVPYGTLLLAELVLLQVVAFYGYENGDQERIAFAPDPIGYIEDSLVEQHCPYGLAFALRNPDAFHHDALMRISD